MIDSFNNDGFDERDLEMTIEQPAVIPNPAEDENAKRYGLSFLINIPLYKHLGNNILLDANKRDEVTHEVIKNQHFFPRLMLIPFKNIQAEIPAEVPASRTSSGSYEANMRTFNPEVAEEQDAMLRTVKKTALKCAELFLNTYRKDGAVVFNGLTGIDTYADAKRLLMAVLPLNDENIFPRVTRTVLGEQFVAPFLDQIIDYLQSAQARERVEKISNMGRLDVNLFELYAEVLAGARNANTIAKAQIAMTEQQIAATPQQKSGYDLRDPLFRDAQDPFDLVCLAHRNEKPKSERQLEQARQMQENNNQPLKAVAESLNQVAGLMIENQRGSQTQVPLVGMTAEDIAALVKTQVAEGIAAFKEETAQTGAENPPRNGEQIIIPKQEKPAKPAAK